MYPYNYIHQFFASTLSDKTQLDNQFTKIEIDNRAKLKDLSITSQVFSEIMGFEIDFSHSESENIDKLLFTIKDYNPEEKAHATGLYFEYIYKASKYKFAVKSYELCVEKNLLENKPFNPRVYFFVCSSMLALDLYPTALTVIDKAIEFSVGKKFVFFALKGLVLRSMKEFDLAADCFVESISRSPKYPPASIALKFLSGHLSKAKCMDIYGTLKGYLKPKSPDNLYGMLVEVAYKAGFVEESNRLLQKQVFNNASKNIKNIGGQVLEEQLNEPDFIIIGMPKCGTTSLYAYLCARPDVIQATTKEVAFFNSKYERGLSWYLSTFPNAVNGTGERLLTGEASPGYVYSNDALSRIDKHTKKTKLIMMFRDPVLRTISAYYQIKKMTGLAISLDEFIEKALIQGAESKVLMKSVYINYINDWISTFGKDRLLLVNAETLFTDDNELQKVNDHLGLSTTGNISFPHSNKGAYPEPSAGVLKRLSDFYQPYNEELYNYLGENLQWK